MPCRNCGRTFLPDRLEIHLRSCDKAYAKKRMGEGSQLSDEATNYQVSQRSIRDSQNYSNSVQKINPSGSLPGGSSLHGSLEMRSNKLGLKQQLD